MLVETAIYNNNNKFEFFFRPTKIWIINAKQSMEINLKIFTQNKYKNYLTYFNKIYYLKHYKTHWNSLHKFFSVVRIEYFHDENKTVKMKQFYTLLGDTLNFDLFYFAIKIKLCCEIINIIFYVGETILWTNWD